MKTQNAVTQDMDARWSALRQKTADLHRFIESVDSYDPDTGNLRLSKDEVELMRQAVSDISQDFHEFNALRKVLK